MTVHNFASTATSESYWDDALERDIGQLEAGRGEYHETLDAIERLRVAHDMNLRIGHPDAARAAACSARLLAGTTLQNLLRPLTTKEAAAITGYTERHLRTLHQGGQLPQLTDGKQRRFRLHDIRRYCQKNPTSPTEVEPKPRCTLTEPTPEATAKRRIQGA